MKLVTSKKTLQQALSILAPIANQRTPLPVLQGINVEVSNGGICSLVATDLHIGARIDIAIEEGEDGSCCIPGKKFFEIAKLFGDDSMVVVAPKGNRIEIKDVNEQTRFELNIFSSDDYPAFAKFDDVPFEEFLIENLTNALARVLFAASNDESRFNLNGVLIDSNKLVSTDGHRLAMETVPGLSVPEKIIIPKKSIAYAKKILEGASTLTCGIGFGTKNIYFRVDNTQISIRLIDGDYPDYNRVIPKDPPNGSVVCDRDDLIAATKRAALVCSGIQRGINLKVTQQSEIELSATSELGSSCEKMMVLATGEPFEVILNNDYLIEALQSLEIGSVSIDWIKDGSPLIIRDNRTADRSDNFTLVMPMRK